MFVVKHEQSILRHESSRILLQLGNSRQKWCTDLTFVWCEAIRPWPGFRGSRKQGFGDHQFVGRQHSPLPAPGRQRESPGWEIPTETLGRRPATVDSRNSVPSE